MKRFLLIIVAIILYSINVKSQEVKISSVPYQMHFENEVLDYKIVSENHLRIVAPANTDLFITPDGGYQINKSPRLVFKPDSDFTLTSKIKPEFKSKWDAGVLLIYNDSNHFAKFCFEYDFNLQARVVSVVCNETADDCNSMAISNGEIYYRIEGSTKGNTFCFSYSEDGKIWFPIRFFRLTKTDNLQIGFGSQSPSGKGCSADFMDISFQNRKP